MRSTLRRMRDQVASIAAPARLGRLAGPRLVVLTYHRVLPREHPEWALEQPGMLISPPALEMHLSELGRHFEFVDLGDWARSCAAGGPLPRLACALTFDDGWRDNFDFAFPLLTRHGVPAMIFLVTDLIGTQASFWPNRMARALAAVEDSRSITRWPEELRRLLAGAGIGERAGPVEARRIDAAIETCKRIPDSRLHELLDEVGAVSPPVAAGRDLLDWDEVRRMQAGGLVSFGSHTRRHTRLRSGLDGPSIADEVKGSAERIRIETGVAPQVFCYPNGDRCEIAQAEVAACYAAAVTTDRGWNGPDSDLLELHRVGLHEDVAASPAGLMYRLLAARGASVRQPGHADDVCLQLGK